MVGALGFWSRLPKATSGSMSKHLPVEIEPECRIGDCLSCVYIYICTHAYIHTYIDIYIYIHIYIYICKNGYTHIYIYIFIYLFAYLIHHI